MIFFMQLHLPYFLWDSFQYAFAAFKIIGITYFMELQFWRFSELILHKLWGEGNPILVPNFAGFQILLWLGLGVAHRPGLGSV